jgi:alkane 1-monooxygenase
MRVSKTLSWRLVCGTYFSFLFFPLFPVALIYGGIWWLVPSALVMIVVPVLDSLAGDDLTPGDLALSKSQIWLLEAAPILFVLGNAAVIGLTAHIVAGFTTSETLFAALSVGMISSIGITAAHELVHKPRWFSRLFGRLGLASVCYLHFEIHHIQGHHVRVGTEDDQSTAWLGESLYQFLFRTLPGSFKESWELERHRLKQRGATTLSFRNQLIQFAFLQSVYLTVIWYLGAWTGIVLFVLQAGVAVFMLETTSYIEHYGLLRSKRTDGRYGGSYPKSVIGIGCVLNQ